MTLALLALLLTGCTEYAREDAAMGSDTNAVGDDALYADDAPLRVDVYPPVSLGDGALLEQSFFVDASAGRVDLALSAPVLVFGVLTGYDASPTADVGVPGAEARVRGTFLAEAPGTVTSRRAQTDDDGSFSTTLVPGDDYTLAWIPEDPAELPFLVITGQSVLDRSDLSTMLDYALPVFGQITDVEGDGVAGLSVQAVDPATGIAGPTAQTDRQGRYLLRLYPGDYDLLVWDAADAARPALLSRVLVDEVDGAEHDLSYGALDAQPIRGQVVDHEGDAVENVLVRLTSVELPGTPGGSVVLELDTPRNGIFADDLLPGRYEVEYIPPYIQGEGESLSPVRLAEPVEITGGTNELPAVVLPQRVRVVAQVLGPGGVSVAGARVRARETGFDRYVFETITDDDGRFELEVSDTELTWTVEPPVGVSAATTFFTADPHTVLDRGQVSLSEGLVIEGRVSWNQVPAENAAIEVRDEQGRLLASALCDAAGRFQVRVAN